MKIQAIVIKSNDRKEKDKSVLLFSLEQGKVWVTLKGVKSPNAKMKLAQNPFCYGEFVLEQTKAGLVVTSFNCLESFHELAEDPDKYFEAAALLEILSSVEQPSARLFVLALRSLKTICFGKVNNLYVLDKFLIEFFSDNGCGLFTTKCTCCLDESVERFFIDYADGKLVCINCRNASCEELSKNVYLALKFLNNTDFDKLHTLHLSSNSELELLKILVKNFDYRFDYKLKLIGILS